MRSGITLDNVTPHLAMRRKVALGGLTLLTVIILMITYVWVGIDPFKLYDKRQNAMSYLFGRQMTEDDKALAMAQARRLPKIILLEETLQEIKQEYAQQGKAPDAAQMHREASERVAGKLATQSPEALERIVQEEYARIIDEKKGGFFPPERHPNHLQKYFMALLETVAIAIWGSLFAVLAAVPVSVLAATNTLEIVCQGDSRMHRAIRWFSYFVIRRFLDFCRGFNEFVMALIFVAVIGLGPFAGVLALAIHTFGVLGKVFSEAIETIDPGQVEAVMASGAGAVQVVVFSVLPQVMPLMVSYSLLRFESNVRSATILGFCGAGGIGFLMFDKLNGYLYREVATMMIMVIISVSIIDYLCGKLRNQFI
jgi:phosphonate transport system permease protein